MISSVPGEVADLVSPAVGGRPLSFMPMRGGCINEGGQLVSAEGTFFIKWNDCDRYPGMFEAEARGLSMLRKATPIHVPAVIHVCSGQTYQCLVLEFVETAPEAPDYWQQLGSGLAQLHRHTAETFGLDHDNYIGSLPQRNSQQTSGVAFFIEYRLRAQLNAIARDDPGKSLAERFEALFLKLPSILPGGPPSLLHGDLWRGNVITTRTGSPSLIDPAVYYGHREADLAMTQLFGGFDRSFMTHYQHEYPLENGFRERADLYNLYPLLVHLRLFGTSYRGQILDILDRFL